MIALFQKEINLLFKEVGQNALREIESYGEHTFTSLDKESVAEALFKKYYLVPLEIFSDNTEQEDIVMTQRRTTPQMFSDKQFYEAASVKYSIPFKGDKRLFEFRPSTYNVSPGDGEIENGKLILYVDTNYSNKKLPDHIIEEVVKGIKSIVEKVEDNIKNQKNDCEKFNSDLQKEIKNVFTRRAEEIKAGNELKNKLNPFKK